MVTYSYDSKQSMRTETQGVGVGVRKRKCMMTTGMQAQHME